MAQAQMNGLTPEINEAKKLAEHCEAVYCQEQYQSLFDVSPRCDDELSNEDKVDFLCGERCKEFVGERIRCPKGFDNCPLPEEDEAEAVDSPAAQVRASAAGWAVLLATAFGVVRLA